MFEGCTIKYGYDLSGVKNQIVIEYPAKEDGSRDVVACPIENPNNRYYKMVMQWVEEGGVINE
jgi:hypothetical protein